MAFRVTIDPPDADADPYCRCGETEGPHVHCPWGGSHIHQIDETPEAAR